MNIYIFKIYIYIYREPFETTGDAFVDDIIIAHENRTRVTRVVDGKVGGKKERKGLTINDE